MNRFNAWCDRNGLLLGLIALGLSLRQTIFGADWAAGFFAGTNLVIGLHFLCGWLRRARG